MNYQDQGDLIAVFDDQNDPPFDEVFTGSLKPDRDGYYVFHSAAESVLTCKQLRTLAKKCSDLNMGPKPGHEE